MINLTKRSIKLMAPVLLVASLGTAQASSYSYATAPAPSPTAPGRPAAQMAMQGMDTGGITDMQTIRNCLCMQSQSQTESGDVAAKTAAYNQALSEKAQLDSTIAAETTSSSSPQQVDKIRADSERRIELQGRINESLIPALQTATAQYNQVANAYDQTCGGKSFDSAAMSQAQVGLTCAQQAMSSPTGQPMMGQSMTQPMTQSIGQSTSSMGSMGQPTLQPTVR